MDTKSIDKVIKAELKKAARQAGDKPVKQQKVVREKPIKPAKPPPPQNGTEKEKKKLGKLIWIVVGICLICLIGWGVFMLFNGAQPCPEVDTQAPVFSLQTIDGKTFALADNKGKMLLIYFWNSSALQVADLSKIQAVYNRWASNKIAIIGIRSGSRVEEVASLVKKEGLTFPILLDSKNEIARQYCVIKGTPLTLLISTDGTIKSKKQGSFKEQTEIEEIIRSGGLELGSDFQPPVISTIALSEITDTSAVFTWTTDKPSTSQVTVTEQGAMTPNVTEMQQKLNTSHMITLLTLKAKSTYTLSVSVNDSNGNHAESTRMFTTLASFPVGAEAGKRAPDFTLKTLEGDNVTLSNYRGKVVLLNFWQKSCVACITEMPLIQTIYEKWPQDKLVIFAINAGESEETIKSFRERWKLTFPILLDPQIKITEMYQVSSIPVTMVIDSQGIIKVVKVGVFDKASEIESLIIPLVK